MDSGAMPRPGIPALQQAAEAAAVIEQGLSAEVPARVERLDLSDDGRVGAAGIGVHDGALEPGERGRDERKAERALPVPDALELLEPGERRGGEATGQGLLVGREDIDGELPARPER